LLPALAPGVLIHIHDVAGNLEYPRDWLESGRAWNEQYLLHAFLMYNPTFRIELFTGVAVECEARFHPHASADVRRGGGGQVWLRKLK